MRSLAATSWAALLAVVLTACGGGGGGGSDAGPALTFTPSTVTANVASGTSATITVRATATDTSIFGSALYVYVVDSQHVLSPSVELAAVDNRTMSATIHTLPTLAAGRYTGTLQVQLCNDASCASQVRGSPVPLPYDLTVMPAPLRATTAVSTAATVHHGGDLPAQVAVSVSGPALGWTATTAAPWLNIVGGTGTGAGLFAVGYQTRSMAEGSYATTVTVRASDGQSVTLPFTLDVLPTQFVLDSGVPSFTAVNGAPIAARTVSFALDNNVPSAWTATSSASWMLADPLAGTTPAVVTLQPDPTRGPLSSGTYGSNLVLSSAGIADKTITTSLTLSKATLSANATTLTLGGTKGRDMTTAQSLSASLNTGTNGWPFALSGLPAWLSTTTPTGSVRQAGTLVSVAPNAAGVTPGSTSATVSMTATVNGEAVVLPITVNLNADQRRLLASEWGVGLASSPTGTVLARTLTIRDNFGGALAWTASSDAAWLTVTASGNTAGSTSLVLTANASALPTDALSQASITVSTATAGVEPAVIRVSLWKSATGLAATTKLLLSYEHLTADKLRPYVYANNGGTTVDVFNAYTAQKIATVTGVGAALGQMSVSPDGSRLYALDTAARAMAVVDLATLTRTGTWTLDNAVSHYTPLLAIRSNGVDIVLVGDGTAYTGGRSVGPTPLAGPLDGTRDGRYVAILGARYGIDYSAMSGGVLFVNFLNMLDSNSGGNEKDVAISDDGTRAYSASGGGVNIPGRYRCASIDAVAGTFIGGLPGGDAYPNNVEVTIDGRAICGIFGWYATSDFWVHAPNGALLQGYKIAGYAKALKDWQMVVTPDGLVVVALTDDPLIAFVPIGP